MAPFESLGTFFTARRVCVARIMPWQDVCLSVCPTGCQTHSGNLSKRLHISSKFFSPSGSPAILVIPHQTGWQYSEWEQLKGESNAKGIWKNYDIWPIYRFISETMQDRATVTTEGEYETAPKLSNGTSLKYLEWPLTHISRSRYYSTLNNSKTVQDRAIFTIADQ